MPKINRRNYNFIGIQIKKKQMKKKTFLLIKFFVHSRFSDQFIQTLYIAIFKKSYKMIQKYISDFLIFVKFDEHFLFKNNGKTLILNEIHFISIIYLLLILR